MQARGGVMAASAEEERQGVGPLIHPNAEASRPLRQQVFERIRAVGSLPRVQVAKELGVSPATVTAIAAELIEAGLIEEVAGPRDADASRGRPPVALGVRPAAHLVAGVKLSDRQHSAVVVDFAGRRVASASVPHRAADRGLDDLLAAADRLIDLVAVQAGVTRDALSAIGLGVPGFVDASAGLVYWSPILRERDVPLAALASARLGLPVHIDNDANLVALAELWFGAGRRLSDFAVVTIEHGVGMGLVINHRIYRGARGLGPELGHTKVHLDGALCRCGQRGCLEAYVADYALVREATTALDLTMREGQSTSGSARVAVRPREGRQRRRALDLPPGGALPGDRDRQRPVNLFDPELVILSGERMRYDYLYAADTLAELDRLILPANRPPPRIEVHAWGDLLWAHGAAALALAAVTEESLGLTPVREAAQLTRGLALALALATLCAAAPAQAAPRFVDRAGDLPAPHVYDGGWEHFVGGGVAVLDCNDDAKPDLFVAGGANPARLFVNVTEGLGAPIRFVEGPPPPLADATGVTGAYPLDVDGDGVHDLAVLRVGPNALLKGVGYPTGPSRDATRRWGSEAGIARSTRFVRHIGAPAALSRTAGRGPHYGRPERPAGGRSRGLANVSTSFIDRRGECGTARRYFWNRASGALSMTDSSGLAAGRRAGAARLQRPALLRPRRL